MEEKHILLGHSILAIWLADDNQALKFDVEIGPPILARADGDCCSHSWIEHLEGPERILNSPVLAAQDIKMAQPRESTNDCLEVIAFYGFSIKTAQGTCVIDYRNSSNGYYGGSLSWSQFGDEENFFYGGVHGQNNSNMCFKKIA